MADEATSHASVGALLRDQMRDALRRAAWATAGLVVLIGEPGMTEASWDDVLEPLPGEWRQLWRPPDAGSLLAGLRAAGPPQPWTVVRLSDLRRFLMPHDAELALELVSTLRGALRPSDRPLVVVATMPPDRSSWRLLTQAPASGGSDPWAQARALLRHAIVLTAVAPAPERVPPPVPEAGPVPRAVPVPEAGPVPQAVPVPEAEPVPQAVSVPEAEPAPQAVPVPEAEPAPQAVSVPEAEPAPGSVVARITPLVVAPGEEPVVAPGEEPVVAPREEPVGTVARARRPRASGAGQAAGTRWWPSALPRSEPAREAPEAVRDRAFALESERKREAAERLYEQAARAGDLVALERLAALRSGQAPRPLSDEAADRMYEAAAAEGNTAVLFGLAAAGHGPALRILARFREEAGEPSPHPD